jgi:nucleotide-binding universal stress UspA family protein
MTSSTTDDTSPSTEPVLGTELPRFAVEPLDARHVVVPLDGSPFAERALPVAGWVADVVGADIHLVEVVPAGDDEAAENATRYLDSACRRHRAAAWDIVQSDEVGDALDAELTSAPARLACLATHGRGRSATVGSVAVSLLERSCRPALLVGPAARPVTASDAPVVVAIDGTARDDTLVSVALGWAARLARPLDIVTVAVPSPPDVADVDAYVRSAAARAEGCGVRLRTRVVRDATDVRDGLVALLDRTSALVVLGAPVRRGVGPLAPGSDATSVVHDAAVPALVVPFPSAT